MSEPYIPKVNDYVIWDKGEYGKDEVWVYFFCEEYITIDSGVKPRPDAECEGSRHKFIHTLLLCHAPFWNELEFDKSRKSKHPQHYSECDN